MHEREKGRERELWEEGVVDRAISGIRDSGDGGRGGGRKGREGKGGEAGGKEVGEGDNQGAETVLAMLAKSQI
jgi:hypothetical protein